MKWELYDELENPYEVYRWLRDEAPLYKTPKQGHYVLSRHADVTAALLDHQTFSSRLTAFPRPEHQPVINMDPPKHDELRDVIIGPFLPREVAKLEGAIRALVTQRLDALAVKGGGDIVTEFSELVPSDVIGGMLGVEEEDRPRLRRWAGDYLSRDAGIQAVPSRSIEAIELIRQYFVERRADRDARPKDDLMTTLSRVKVRGNRLSDKDFAGMCALLAVAGYETTAHLMTHTVVELFRHQDQRAWLVDHPAGIPNAIKEVVRYRPPVHLVGRLLTREFHAHGTTIPKGTPAILLIAAACRDERRYYMPDQFDVRREDTDSLGFGQGRHTCFGAPLARLELKVVLEELLGRFPTYEVDEASVTPMGPGETSGYVRAMVQLR
jgi:cytochrome P450